MANCHLRHAQGLRPLVFLGIDSGLMGVGERLTRLASPRRDRDAMLVGQRSFRGGESLMEMYGSTRGRGQSKGFMVEAISGVDMGLEDPLGKALDQPIRCLLECSPRFSGVLAPRFP